MVGGWPFLQRRVVKSPLAKGGDVEMMMDYITLASLLLAVFVTGVAVGKLVEKIERFISRKEDEEHGNTQKNNRR